MSDEPFFPKPRVTESTCTAVTLDDPDLLPPARQSSCHYQVIATIGMCLSVYSGLVLTVCPVWPESPAFMKILAQQQNCSGIFYLLGQPYSNTIAETTTITLILLVFLLFFISYWRSSCTNPGVLKRLIDFENPTVVVGDVRDDFYCVQCEVHRPPRCHHCSRCQECVMLMDHHCYWIDNCVGLYNYKFFFLVLIYGIIGCTLLIALFSWRWYVILDDFFHDMKAPNSTAALNSDPTFQMKKLWQIILLGVCTVFILLEGLVLVRELRTHVRRLMTGETQLERVYNLTEDAVNLGCWKNTQSTFGPNPLLWWLPTAPKSAYIERMFFRQLVANRDDNREMPSVLST